MPLQWQTIDVSLSGGFDTKADEQIVDHNRASLLNNVEFDRIGSIKRRDGFALYDRTFSDTPRKLIGVGDEALVGTDRLCESANETDAAVLTRGFFTPVDISAVRFASTPQTGSGAGTGYVRHADVATDGTYAVYVWDVDYDVNTTDGTRLYIMSVHLATGRRIVDASINSSRAEASPTVVYNAAVDRFFISYGTGTGWSIIRMNDPDDPSDTSSWVTGSYTATYVGTGESSRLILHTDNTTNDLYLAYHQAPGSSGTDDLIFLAQYSAGNGATNWSHTIAHGGATGAELFGLDIQCNFAGTTDTLAVVWNVAGTTLRMNHFNSSGSILSGTAVLETAHPVPDHNGNIAIIDRASDANDYDFYIFSDSDRSVWENSASSNQIPGTYRHTVSYATSGSPSVSEDADEFVAAMALMHSRPWSHNGQLYLALQDISGGDPDVFVVDAETLIDLVPRTDGPFYERRILARMGRARASLYNPSFRKPSHVAGLTSTEYAIAGREEVLARGTTQTFITGYQLEFDEPSVGQVVKFGPTEIIRAGVLLEYDRLAVADSGLPLPDVTGVSNAESTPTTGGSMSDGTYLFRFVFSTTDGDGRVYLSEPSSSVSVTLSGGTSTQRVELNIPKPINSLRAPVSLLLYRTTAGGTTFFFEDQFELAEPTIPGTIGSFMGSSSWLTNPQGVFSTLSDADLQDNATLYTTGGVLPNTLAPSMSSIAVANNRVFGVESDLRTRIWFSKKYNPLLGTEWSASLVLDVGSRNGDIVAIEGMDDKVIIFYREAIAFLTGDGPNELGQGQFLPLQGISSDVGCISRASVVSYSEGILFQSVKGIYRLQRSLQVDYIGAPVENEANTFGASGTIISALDIPSQRQIRLTFDNDNVLVYDYYVQQWTRFTLPSTAISATILSDKYAYLDDAEDIHVQDASLTLDDGSSFTSSYQTGWIKFTQIAGYQRVRWLTINGTRLTGDHDLTIDLYYDYDDTSAETITMDSTTALTSGDDTYLFRIKPGRQKCSALRVKVDMTINGAASEPESFARLTSLTAQVGIKGGTHRLSNVKTL